MYTYLHGSLLIYRPLRDGWLSWPCWLTDSGRLNHTVVIHPASSLAQDKESSPAETSVLTTMLRRQLRQNGTGVHTEIHENNWTPRSCLLRSLNVIETDTDRSGTMTSY